MTKQLNVVDEFKPFPKSKDGVGHPRSRVGKTKKDKAKRGGEQCEVNVTKLIYFVKYQLHKYVTHLCNN